MSALDEIKARASGHTPGPWEVHADTHEYRGGAFMQVEPKVGARTICEVTDQHKANAELIAAAPKLLAALEAVEGLANGMDCASKDDTPGAWDLGYNTALRSAAGLIRDVINEALEGAE